MADVALGYLPYYHAYGYNEGDSSPGYPLVCATWAKKLAGDPAGLLPSIRVTVSDRPFPGSLSLTLNAPKNEDDFHTSINGGPAIDSYASNLETALDEMGLDSNLVHFRITAETRPVPSL